MFDLGILEVSFQTNEIPLSADQQHLFIMHVFLQGRLQEVRNQNHSPNVCASGAIAKGKCEYE